MSTPSDPSNDAVRIDRGKLLKRSAGIALGASLYSFGDPLTVLAAQTSPKALKPDGDLAYFNWAQYINPKLLRGFEKEYGVKVKESNFTNMDNMLAKLRAGVKYDVAFPEAQTAAQLVKANFLAPLEPLEHHELVAGQLRVPQPLVRRGREVHGAVRDLDDRHRLAHRQGQGHDRVVERPLQPSRGGQAHATCSTTCARSSAWACSPPARRTSTRRARPRSARPRARCSRSSRACADSRASTPRWPTARAG